MYLPIIVESPVSLLSDPTVDLAPVPGPARRILVVDDNLDAATTLAKLLNLTGNETHIAHDGLAAVEAAETFDPD